MKKNIAKKWKHNVTTENTEEAIVVTSNKVKELRHLNV
jgi:hypothetical protein